MNSRSLAVIVLLALAICGQHSRPALANDHEDDADLEYLTEFESMEEFDECLVEANTWLAGKLPKRLQKILHKSGLNLDKYRVNEEEQGGKSMDVKESDKMMKELQKKMRKFIAPRAKGKSFHEVLPDCKNVSQTMQTLTNEFNCLKWFIDDDDPEDSYTNLLLILDLDIFCQASQLTIDDLERERKA